MRNIKSRIRKTFPNGFKLLSFGKQLIVAQFVKRQKKNLKTLIKAQFPNESEVEEVNKFLASGRVEMIPYAFADEYRKLTVNVVHDNITGLKYTLVGAKRIYFPQSMSDQHIADSVRVGLMEQDSRSPHKYLPTETISIGGDVAILCGASDGIYTLEIIDKFKKVYLFEANTDWVEPIRNTLKDYLHKIEIVPKFVSNTDGKDSVTIDSFIKDKGGVVNYIQADIEGHELAMLEGAKNLLDKSENLKMSLCCYHTTEQEKELSDFLKPRGFNVGHAPGYLLLWMQYPLKPPYLRRGVLYATK